MITLEWDLGILRDGTRRMERAITAAVRKAGRDGLRAMKAESSRQVRARKKFKVARINRGMPTSTKGGTLDSMEWRMDVSGGAEPVIGFGARQTQKGVTFGVNAGKRSLIKHAFIVTMKSGHQGVFYRMGKARLPIDEAFTTRLSDVMKDEGLIPAIEQRTMSVLRASFMRLLPLELEKIK